MIWLIQLVTFYSLQLNSPSILIYWIYLRGMIPLLQILLRYWILICTFFFLINRIRHMSWLPEFHTFNAPWLPLLLPLNVWSLLLRIIYVKGLPSCILCSKNIILLESINITLIGAIPWILPLTNEIGLNNVRVVGGNQVIVPLLKLLSLYLIWVHIKKYEIISILNYRI